MLSEVIILSSSHALELSLISSAYALEVNILPLRVDDSLGAPKVHPMGVAPELWVDFWKQSTRRSSSEIIFILLLYFGWGPTLSLILSYALEVGTILAWNGDSWGAPKVHPMGVAPELWVDFWK